MDQQPVVESAQVPFYPPFARTAGLTGVVKVEVTTDGKKVVKTEVKNGQPLLAKAAVSNINTWQFKPHPPTTFVVVYTFSLSTESYCEPQNEELEIHFPSSVEIKAKRIKTCDPIESH